MVDFHKRILFSDEAHFWLKGYVNKQNCLISSEANPQVYVETQLHPEKLTSALYGLVESLVRTSSKTMPTTGVPLAPSHDEFRGPRSDYIRQVALETTTTTVPKHLHSGLKIVELASYLAAGSFNEGKPFPSDGYERGRNCSRQSKLNYAEQMDNQRVSRQNQST
ncbi:hypothetical protein TNCV_3691831 [Trichonephila clavipes]|nr:hypothetical protein TNCV_3691831 [Trichonephila clavipes]